MRGTVFRTLEWKAPPDLALVKGDRPTEFAATIRDQAKEMDGYVTVCTTDDTGKKCVFPENMRPVLDVEFPPARVGDKPVRKSYVLGECCCGNIFHGPVRVPDEAGVGKAKVIISFEAWKEGGVTPSTIEIPVVKPRTGKK